MRDRKPRQARFGLRAETGSTLIPDLTAGARRCARKWRNRRRVIVRLHLSSECGWPSSTVTRTRGFVRSRHQAPALPIPRSPPHCHCTRTITPSGVFSVVDLIIANRRFVPGLLTIDNPARVENLVPAVLRICLRKHHELGIGRVATKITVASEQGSLFLLGTKRVRDLLLAATSAFLPSDGELHFHNRRRLMCRKQCFGKFSTLIENRLSHSIR